MLWAYFVKVNLESDEYSVSRWLMGIAESPLPVLFFIATSKLNEELRIKNQNDKKNVQIRNISYKNEIVGGLKTRNEKLKKRAIKHENRNPKFTNILSEP